MSSGLRVGRANIVLGRHAVEKEVAETVEVLIGYFLAHSGEEVDGSAWNSEKRWERRLRLVMAQF